jgi:pilus assembly protein Flp/PilA
VEAGKAGTGERSVSGLKKSRQPTEETCDGSTTGESTPTKRREEEKEMLKKFFAKLSDEEGQGLVEYALIIVLVSIVCMVALRLLGVNIGAIFTRITNILIAG